MPHETQPKESDLELVVSLTSDDVEAIDHALLQQVSASWTPSSEVVTFAHQFLQSAHPAVPQAFFSYRLRKLVAANKIEADSPATRELKYQVRDIGHA